MKKLTLILMALALVIGLTGIAMANGDGLGIKGSAHDFSDGLNGGSNGAGNSEQTWNTRGEICRVCHVPHDHTKTAQLYTNGLLWNHTLSAETAYSMYNNAWSETITGIQTGQPDGTSKLCLGCHDGTVGIDQFDAKTVGTVNIADYDAGYKVPGVAGFASDLRGTHPLSISFPAGQTGDGKNFTDPASATWADGSTVASTLDNGKVQCSTCHEVHNQGSIGNTHLLRAVQKDLTGANSSALCLTCHVK